MKIWKQNFNYFKLTNTQEKYKNPTQICIRMLFKQLTLIINCNQNKAFWIGLNNIKKINSLFQCLSREYKRLIAMMTNFLKKIN